MNLLRVFVVVAEAGSVTRAAQRLYLTQPAVSAALRRLTASIGAPLFARRGRGLVLTARGRRLLEAARPHLQALVDAARGAPGFDPATSDRVVRLGLSDAMESWLLPPLLRALEQRAPGLRLVVLPVQFRTVAEQLATRAVDTAITVADELPTDVCRQPLFRGEFVCVYDPRRVRLGARTRRRDYFANEHVIVTYGGDLRGIVEDLLGERRRVRCAVSSFRSVGAIVDRSALIATVPRFVGQHILRERPHLRVDPLPLPLEGGVVELLWPLAVDDDECYAFLRAEIVEAARALTEAGARRRRAAAR